MRGTVNEMRNDKTTKILARSGYERAVWLRIFIRGSDLSQLADTAVAAALFRYVMASSLPPDPGSEEIHGKGASTLVDGPGGRYMASPTTQWERGPWKSRWYIWKVHVDGMGR